MAFVSKIDLTQMQTQHSSQEWISWDLLTAAKIIKPKTLTGHSRSLLPGNGAFFLPTIAKRITLSFSFNIKHLQGIYWE